MPPRRKKGAAQKAQAQGEAHAEKEAEAVAEKEAEAGLESAAPELKEQRTTPDEPVHEEPVRPDNGSVGDAPKAQLSVKPSAGAQDEVIELEVEARAVEQKTRPKPAALSSEDMQTRLFQLRMKINQGRKANQAEVEEEYNRINKGRKKSAKGADDDDGESRKAPPSEEDALLNQTAQEAEWEAHKAKKKADIAATYGLSAFAGDASYRAYEKRVRKLQVQRPGSAETATAGAGSSSSAVTALEDNPLDYGRVGAKVSAASLDKLQQDVLAREADRKKFSRRRLATDALDVDYINDKNAAFNKKLKNSYDKYTVEIRQNLERGTAI